MGTYSLQGEMPRWRDRALAALRRGRRDTVGHHPRQVQAGWVTALFITHKKQRLVGSRRVRAQPLLSKDFFDVGQILSAHFIYNTADKYYSRSWPRVGDDNMSSAFE
jgi:hypothetical protein